MCDWRNDRSSVLPSESDAAIQMMQVQEKPDVTFADIGGLDSQKQ